MSNSFTRHCNDYTKQALIDTNIVARNNEWDDNQKIRFFSDRLKGEAFEWHENYAEEEGDDLNYQDWKEALITRFQDTYDLATLEKKLSKLTQKPEENCRAFVSRLNNLYDTIAGKEERADHNQTIIEGQLLNKVKKMRDHRKSKILLQGLLPKYKAELYLRMPENTEDFDALCKQLFISEKILHTKEATDDKEMSAVIAGITHHEKQQDDKIQLLEQKLSEALSELKCTNTKRGSSQENDVTIAATDQYENRRPRPSERYSRSRDSRVRFADSHNSRESSRERSLSRNRDNSPTAEITIRQDEEIIILQDTGKPDFHLTNVPHIGTTTPTDKETKADQTTTDNKHVITATNIYSNKNKLATTLELLKIKK
ncbi:hypothetical protein OUZ56_033310 [Daphnia magna]|uniref:Ty3 transposon capsid-like protein domain-containing protein n=1 Tax=Daphnia magna TaxID=35525 RepID=A0ABR0BAL6_9CRUS|nr:hypothetical protein OUZ56_033310 [Daphnia magna]